MALCVCGGGGGGGGGDVQRGSIHLCACMCGECARRPDTSDVQG